MRTSAIAHRVADFLKQHQPFQFMTEPDLLELACSGRVKFHESDEYVFQQGGLRKPQIFVIQQGRVELLSDEETGETLYDVLGEGDILGLGGFQQGQPSDSYTSSARTASDVVLYILDSTRFGQAVQDTPRVARYLSAYFSVGAPGGSNDVEDGSLGPEGRDFWWPWETKALEELAAQRLLIRSAAEPVREVARAMAQRQLDAVTLVDEQGVVAGVVTVNDLRDRVATGDVALEAPARDLLGPSPHWVSAGVTAADATLALLRAGGRPILIGSPKSPRGVLTSRELTVMAGKDPATLAREIGVAEDFEQLRVLAGKCLTLIAEELTEVGRTPWLAAISSELFSGLLRRILEFESAADPIEAGVSECWLLLGTAARGELIGWHDIDLGVIHGGDDEVQIRYERLVGAVRHRLEACGVSPSKAAIQQRVNTLDGWKRYYQGLVQNPILNRIYESRPMFDFAVTTGDVTLAEELRLFISTEVAANDNFLPLLANDSMANLPPLTFYDGLVMEGRGGVRDTLDLNRSAILPLVDVARVFGLAGGGTTASTAQRYELAGRAFSDHSAAFGEASEALNIALYYRARSAFRDGGDGTLLRPFVLSKYDQQLLKSVFRSVLALLKLTAARFGVTSRS